MGFKIFVVEDNHEIVNLLRKSLSSWGFLIEACHDFNHVKTEVDQFAPHLILMDINLPYHNGFFWTQAIRKDSVVPIIFLSSRDDNTDQILAMNFGGDDYVTKPFNIELLIVKINALLRREYTFLSDRSVLKFQDFSLDIIDDQLRTGTHSVTLTRNETKLLHLLFSHQYQVVSREDIMSNLWDNDIFIDRNTLSVTLARLRQKTATIGFAKFLVTVKGKGLSLND